MRQTGWGVFYEFDEIPEGDRRTSPDGKRIAAFWVRRHKEDRYDEDTVYSITVWDARSHKEVDSYTHIHAINRESGEADGLPLKDLHWDADGNLLLVFSDGSTEPAAPPRPDPVPPSVRRRQGN